jgi:serine/threonine-protein kinase
MVVRADAGKKLIPGTRLGGKYHLVRRIAFGGMGEIWVAKNRMTDATVALKVLLPDESRADGEGGDPQVQAAQRREAEPRFRHEAKLGATLSHRNIVKVYDFLEEPDGSLALVMELLRGETLHRYMRTKKTLDAAEVVAIVLPLLSALEHAHETGVIHRDLKPANIILDVDPDGHVTPKLLDFGIAKVPLAGVATLDGRVLGTPQYMSPEQIRSDAKIDGRSDLFTIGILMFHMLTGVSPFDAGSPSASLAAVLETPIDPDPRIDPRLWLVIQRTVSKRAYERFATAGELATALRAAVSFTDADLAATMRREKPPRRSAKLDEQVLPLDLEQMATGPTEDVSVGSSIPLNGKRTRLGAIAIAVGVAAVAAFGIAAFVSARSAPYASPKVTAATAPAPTTGVAAASSVPAVEGSIELDTPPVPAAASVTATPPPTSRPRGGTTKPPRKKPPVATHVDF